MDPTPPGGLGPWQLVLFPVFSAFGGFLGFVLRQLDAGNKVSMTRAVIESAGAGFAGVLVMLVCQAMHLSPQWTGVAVGVFGWLGATATIGVLAKILRKKLGISDDGGSTDESH